MGDFNTKELSSLRMRNMPAGIIQDVKISNMAYSMMNGGRMEITLERQGEEFKTYVFCPDRERSRSEKSYKRQVAGAMKRILEVLWCFYPDKNTPIDADTFPEFCQYVLAKYKEAKNKSKVKCYAVFVYNKRGYLGLRQEIDVDNIQPMIGEEKPTLALLDSDVLIKPRMDNSSYTKGSDFFGSPTKDENEDELPF